ncbi:MAG: SDR family oxidoreductase [Hyphomonas sp.]|nr:SDR family oxidoreductase [Hyphomonas sp.]
MPTAIVTGCSRPTGFGQLTAKTLARAGFDVFATMRRASERRVELDSWAMEQDLSLTVLEHDVLDPTQNRNVVKEVKSITGRVDVLVNNVGMSSFGALETLHSHHIHQVMETNFYSAADMTRAVLPVMRTQEYGRVIFVSSMAGVTGIPGESIYCASKFALEGMAESLAMEMARFGVSVSTIRPAFFNTGMSMHNTDASTFFYRGTPYDAFNDQVVTSTSEGEIAGENPQLVADTILEAATAGHPKLRYEPGIAAPEILAGRKAMNDEEWRAFVMSELGMSDLLKPEEAGVPA